MKEIPIWEKSNLSLEEAAAYSGIGINKLREITNEDRSKSHPGVWKRTPPSCRLFMTSGQRPAGRLSAD